MFVGIVTLAMTAIYTGVAVVLWDTRYRRSYAATFVSAAFMLFLALTTLWTGLTI